MLFAADVTAKFVLYTRGLLVKSFTRDNEKVILSLAKRRLPSVEAGMR